MLRLTHEGDTNLVSLSDFDKKNIEYFPSVFQNVIPAIDTDSINMITAEPFVSGDSVSSISVSRIITAVNAAKPYGLIDRVMNPKKWPTQVS